MNLFEKHQPAIMNAITAIHKREFYAHFPEMPSGSIYGETANETGKSNYEQLLSKNYTGLLQSGQTHSAGEEISPFTQKPLGIKYPVYNPENIITFSSTSFSQWKNTYPAKRAGVLMEALEKIKQKFFDIAYATMHTTGQAFMMSFQASGPHANDRALEAIAIGYEEQTRFPETATWDKPMGKINVTLRKKWKIIPRGIGLVIGCSTFPVWNSLPGIFANLITGNVTIVKPHPSAVLPIAIVVTEIQKTLKENGFNPDICFLAADTSAELIAKKLAENKSISMIDFTGGPMFGEYVESLKNKIVFTEKAGVNSAIIDSVQDLNLVMQNLAFSLSLYSGQMCTAPQNIFIPEDGIYINGRKISYDETVSALVNCVKGLAMHPKMGFATLGAIQNENTLKRVHDATQQGIKVLLNSEKVMNPEFPDSRTVSPVLLETNSQNGIEIINKEWFGPISIIVKTKNTDESIQLAKELALKKGALSCAAYSIDAPVMEKIETEMTSAGAPVSFNLTGPIWVNQHAGFSDFHVTGCNPAGNASFTNPEFVLKRFSLVGVRMPV